MCSADQETTEHRCCGGIKREQGDCTQPPHSCCGQHDHDHEHTGGDSCGCQRSDDQQTHPAS